MWDLHVPTRHQVLDRLHSGHELYAELSAGIVMKIQFLHFSLHASFIPVMPYSGREQPLSSLGTAISAPDVHGVSGLHWSLLNSLHQSWPTLPAQWAVHHTHPYPPHPASPAPP